MAKAKATGDCATCPFWKKKASPIKGKLIPGGTGKCTRPEGLCENHKPKDPINTTVSQSNLIGWRTDDNRDTVTVCWTK